MHNRQVSNLLICVAAWVLSFGQADAQVPGLITHCEFGNVVDTWQICSTGPEGSLGCYETSLVVDTFNYCTTLVVPSQGGFVGGGGGGGTATTYSGDQDGNGVADCWTSLTLNASASITSPFGPRIHPVTGQQHNHNGIDIGVSTGTVLRAAQGGVVAQIFNQYAPNSGTGNGNFVRINYDDGTQGVYLHMENVYVQAGDHVVVGRVIGTSNNTGTTDGPHLHYSLWKSANHGNGILSDLSNFHDPEQVYSSCGP